MRALEREIGEMPELVDGREQVVSKVIDLAAGQSVELSLDPAQRTASADSTASTL